ncbi:hypothetical protein BV898_17011 [Hypsibius exemplaris]|uniref:Uncharacterized protein n=1 Tax=Hypsibius exemplaris TaxID=2072580 RepID=A0A9X6NEB1_HYPEX|nr:hypothetical protein BV898_17011 [Hypsibius exemplaris]
MGAPTSSLDFSSFGLINDQKVLTDNRSNLENFTLSARPGTDIWRKNLLIAATPKLDEDFTAPRFVGKVAVAGFVSATLTFNASWTRVYDQAGLVLVLPQPAPGSSAKRQCWLKSGIEMLDGIAMLGATSATIEISREPVNPTNGKGASLHVDWIQPNGKRILIRDITWMFEGDLSGEVEVGAYVARPIRLEEDAGTPSELLTLHFTDLQVKYRDN